MYKVYILQIKQNGKFYAGSTPNIERRIEEHNKGKVKSTAPYIPYELIYYESYRNKQDAIKRERNLKHHGQGIRRLKECLAYSILSLCAG